MDWFRMYGEMIDDPKIGTLDDAAFRTWVELLCAACKAEDNGNTHLKQADLNWVFRRNADVTLQQLLQRELVTISETGDVVITSWEKRQRKSDSSAERVRAHRAKAKQDKDSEDGNDTETLQKRSANGLEKSREEKSRKKEEVPSSLAADEVAFEFPLNDGSAYQLSLTQIAEFEQLYPAVNVDGELRACLGWNRANPKKRKTRSGILKHINSWLSDKQNSPRQGAVVVRPEKFDPVAYVNRNRPDRFAGAK